MKDFMFVKAKNQTKELSFLKRFRRVILEVLMLSGSALALIAFALIVGLR